MNETKRKLLEKLEKKEKARKWQKYISSILMIVFYGGALYLYQRINTSFFQLEEVTQMSLIKIKTGVTLLAIHIPVLLFGGLSQTLLWSIAFFGSTEREALIEILKEELSQSE